jgi:hypothetical protein
MPDNSSSSTSPLVTGVLVALGVAAVVALLSVLGGTSELPKTSEMKITKAAEATSETKVGSSAAEAAAPVETADSLEPEVVSDLRERLEIPTAVPNEAVLTFANKEALMNFLRGAGGLGLKVLARLDDLHGVRIGFDDLAALERYMASSGKGPNAPQVEPNTWMTTPQLPKPASGNEGGTTPFGADYLKAIEATGDRTDWGLGETGAAGPTGNKYGDAAGHVCVAVAGPGLGPTTGTIGERARTLETGSTDRLGNMQAFAAAALLLLAETLEGLPPAR